MAGSRSLPLDEGEKNWPRQVLLGVTARVSDTPRGQSCTPLGSARVATPALILSCSDCVDKRPSWPPLPCQAHTHLW